MAPLVHHRPEVDRRDGPSELERAHAAIGEPVVGAAGPGVLAATVPTMFQLFHIVALHPLKGSVHAYCLMPNHFHLVVEAPQPTLVAGMK